MRKRVQASQNLKVWGTFFVLATVLMGCKRQSPRFVYMPDMVYSPAVKAQSEGAMKSPVIPGTVSRDFQAYPYHQDDQEKAGKELKNPLKPTSTVMKRGQHIYETYCFVCHGKSGEGDGSIVPKFPRPPSFHTNKVRNWSDGMIYHEITTGMNLMPSYASQILPQDRWAVIYYVRALQRAKNPSPSDLKKFEEYKSK